MQVTFPGTHDDMPDGEPPQGEHLLIFCVLSCAVGVCRSASESHAATLCLRQLAGDSSSSGGGGSSSRKSDQQDQARRAVNRIANAAAAAVGLDDQNNRHLITASYDDL